MQYLQLLKGSLCSLPVNEKVVVLLVVRVLEEVLDLIVLLVQLIPRLGVITRETVTTAWHVIHKNFVLIKLKNK